MCAPVDVTSCEAAFELALHVGGVGRVQDVGPVPLVLAVDHLPASGQQHHDVRLDLVDGPSSHWYGHGWSAAGSPGVSTASRCRPDGVSSRAPMSSTCGPVDHPATEDPLVREHVAVLVLDRCVSPRPSPSVRATESPKSRTRTGGPPRGRTDVGGRGVRRRPVVARAARCWRTAEVPVVAATIATRTTPTPAGTTSQARHWLTKVPMRIGRSTRWNDTTDTAKVTTTRQREELVALEPGPGVVEPQEDRPVPDVEPVGDAADVADGRDARGHAARCCAGAATAERITAADRQADEEEAARVGERGQRGGQHPDRHRGRRPGDAEHAAEPFAGAPGGPPQLALGQAARLVAACGPAGPVRRPARSR